MIDAEAYRLHTYWTATRVVGGGGVGPEASMNKLFWSETDLAIHTTALELLGEHAEMLDDDARPPPWLDGYLFALAGPIYAGTNEIQRNVVAERVLGLPAGLTVHFAFDEHQLEFRAQLRAFADKECTPAALREAWASPSGWSRARWTALAEMGVVGLTVPEEHGGMGLGLVDLVLLLEEAGRAGMPEPLVETTALGVPVFLEAPGAQGDALRARWLSSVADGGAAIAVGMSSMPAVPGAEGADLLLLERDGELHAVPAAAVALTPRPCSTAPGAWRRSSGSRPRRRSWSRVSKPRGSSPASRTGRRWAWGRCWWAWRTGSSPWPRTTPRSGCSSESRSGPSRP